MHAGPKSLLFSHIFHVFGVYIVYIIYIWGIGILGEKNLHLICARLSMYSNEEI